MLTQLVIKNAKGKDKTYRLHDRGGLYLEVSSTGGKYWRYKYRIRRFNKLKEKRLAIGVYPEIDLKEARERHRLAHLVVSSGGDPSAEKQQRKAEEKAQFASTFGEIGKQWFETQSSTWSDTHRTRQTRLFFTDLLALHPHPITEIAAPLLLKVLRDIEARGAIETARRTCQVASQVFDFGIAMGETNANPATAVRKALKKPIQRHHAAILDPAELGIALRAMDRFKGFEAIKVALLVTPYLLVRPGELRHMEWQELDLNAGRWLVPAHKTKRRRDLFVPLAPQVVALIESLKLLTGGNKYVFPLKTNSDKPMTENAVRDALRQVGISKDIATPHGFRATARTLMAERLGFRDDLINHQLSHVVRDSTGEAYNRTRFLPERTKMMTRWADFLDELKRGERNTKSNVSIFQRDSAI